MIKIPSDLLSEQQHEVAAKVYSEIINRNYAWYVSAIANEKHDTYRFIFKDVSDYVEFVLRAL